MSGTEAATGEGTGKELPARTDVSLADRMVAVRAAHEILTGIREHVRRRFGQAVGPVYVMAHRIEEERDAVDRDTFQIHFKLGTQSISLTVLMIDLERNGTDSIDQAYDKLMGKSK